MFFFEFPYFLNYAKIRLLWQFQNTCVLKNGETQKYHIIETIKIFWYNARYKLNIRTWYLTPAGTPG